MYDLINKGLYVQRISEKFFYGSIDLCHCIVGGNAETRNLVLWLRTCWMRLVAASEESGGSLPVGYMLDVRSSGSWLCFKFVLKSTALVVVYSVFWTSICFLANGFHHQRNKHFSPTFCLSVCLSLLHTYTYYNIPTMPIFYRIIAYVVIFPDFQLGPSSPPTAPQLQTSLWKHLKLCLTQGPTEDRIAWYVQSRHMRPGGRFNTPWDSLAPRIWVI